MRHDKRYVLTNEILSASELRDMFSDISAETIKAVNHQIILAAKHDKACVILNAKKLNLTQVQMKHLRGMLNVKGYQVTTNYYAGNAFELAVTWL